MNDEREQYSYRELDNNYQSLNNNQSIDNNYFRYLLNLFFIILVFNYIRIYYIKIYNNLKLRYIKRGEILKYSNLLTNCPICLEDININEKIIKLSCNHCYHKSCLLPWINVNKTCPMCRIDIP